LILGTIISLTANSWFLAWLGFEINVIRFIPLTLYKISFECTEIAIKYFLVQAFASLIIIIFSAKELQNSTLLYLSFQSSMIFIALSLKMGVAPLHFWFPQISKKINWNLILILITWQKIAPIILITSFSKLFILPFFALASAFWGALGGINQSNFKLILTFSSIAHRGWIILLCSTSINITFLYFLVYLITVIFIIWSLKSLKKKNIRQIALRTLNFPVKLFLVMNVLSLGGLPPFLGFSVKIFSVLVLVNFFSFIYPYFSNYNISFHFNFLLKNSFSFLHPHKLYGQI